jgi:hypothetical protein
LGEAPGLANTTLSAASADAARTRTRKSYGVSRRLDFYNTLI